MPDPGTTDFSAMMEMLPLDIIEAVLVSLIKVFGEQPAIETLLELSSKVAENNLQNQSLVNQQLVLHNLTVAGTVKCIEMVDAINPKDGNAPEKLRQCLKTMDAFTLPQTPAPNPTPGG